MSQREFIPNTAKDGVSVEVLNALKAGDQGAYEKVFICYYNKLLRFIEVLIRSEEEAEDLTQEIFANLWLKRENLDPNKNFNSFLYTSARNAVLNQIRSKKVRSNYAADFQGFDLGEASDELVIARETELLVKITVSRMPEQRRNVYEMSRSEGLSNDEIATRLGVSKNAVEKQLRYALKDIKEVITLFLLFFVSS